MKMLKTLLVLLCSCAFSAAVVGCSASASLDPNATGNSTGASQSSDKTTVVHPDGSTETQTQVHTNNP